MATMGTMTIDVSKVRVPHMHEYFGIWAMYGDRFQQMAACVEQMDLIAHVNAQQGVEAGNRPSYDISRGGVAMIDLRGSLMKQADSLSGGTSTVFARRQIRDAAKDDSVAAILLVIDSPGGTVSGINDLAEEVVRARKSKPVWAYIEDIGASAAYWVASQADKIFAGSTAEVGSIGTFAVVQDLSGMAEQQGVKVYVLRAGQFKGAGVPGTEITEEQLQEWQRLVEELNAFFLGAVSRGRGMALARVKELADGRVHVAGLATTLGLIDGVSFFEEVLEKLETEARTGFQAQETRSDEMAEQKTTEVKTAASYADIKTACVGADAGFICDQLERNATVDEAQQAWMAEQQRRVEDAEAKAKAAKQGVDGLGGGKPPESGSEESGDAIERFDSLVREKVKGGMNRQEAVAQIMRSHPEAHKAYLLATNPGKQAQRLIEEKY